MSLLNLLLLLCLVVLFLYLFFLGPSKLFNCACACADFAASDDTQKSHRSRHRTHKSSGSSHKTMSRSLSCDSQSKGSISTPRGSTVWNICTLVLFLCLYLLVSHLAFPRKASIFGLVFTV